MSFRSDRDAAVERAAALQRELADAKAELEKLRSRSVQALEQELAEMRAALTATRAELAEMRAALTATRVDAGGRR